MLIDGLDWIHFILDVNSQTTVDGLDWIHFVLDVNSQNQ